jgi:hypothetical protein
LLRLSNRTSAALSLYPAYEAPTPVERCYRRILKAELRLGMSVPSARSRCSQGPPRTPHANSGGWQCPPGQ